MTTRQHMDMLAASTALLCRVEIVNGKLQTFTFKDKAVGLYIDAGIVSGSAGGQTLATGYHSIVQDLAWPSSQDEGPLTMPAQINQHPTPLWYQEELLAHTLLHRQMLKPAMSAAQLQVTCSTLHLQACALQIYVMRVCIQDGAEHCICPQYMWVCRVSSWSRATLKARLAGKPTRCLRTADLCCGHQPKFGRLLSINTCWCQAVAQSSL